MKRFVAKVSQLSLPNMPDSGRKHFFFTYAVVSVLTIESLFLMYIYGALALPSFLDPGGLTGRDILPPPIVYEASSSAKPQLESSTSAELTQLNDRKAFHILILGIDRRHASDASFRSDVNLLMSFSADRRKVLLTSIPRDLWMDGSRINAFITSDGVDSVEGKIKAVTGFSVDRYVQVDFDAFVDGVDALGGLDVDVLRTFTDNSYPTDRSGTQSVISVTFDQGVQHMDGETALIFARSRKGNNGEGSDFMRMARQQQLLKSMAAAFMSPKNIFNPFVAEDFYSSVKNRFKTDFSLKDIKLAYELLKTHGDVTVDTFVLDTKYLYTPSPSDYGGAYVLRPNGETFAPIQSILQKKLR